MFLTALTRRQFLVIGGSLTATTLSAARTGAQRLAPQAAETRAIYRLSARGRRGSNAAKKHNANLLFATRQAAEQYRAHPGDHSRIVQLTVTAQYFRRLFPTSDAVIADLRKPRVLIVGDCNDDTQVTIGELVRGVGISLGRNDLSVCRAFDRNGDNRVSIDELITAVNNALR